MLRMTRKEYMETPVQGREHGAKLHHTYYYGLAEEAGITTLPQHLTKLAKESKDPHFNDVPLALWDRQAELQKGQVAGANRRINGQAVWSLCDGVCLLKAVAHKLFRQTKEEDEDALG